MVDDDADDRYLVQVAFEENNIPDFKYRIL